MFCVHCGLKLDEGVKFCTRCGSAIEEKWKTGDEMVPAIKSDLAKEFDNNVQQIPADEKITEKWIWALATVPVALSLILTPLFIYIELSTFVVTAIQIVLNIVFITKDVKVLNEASKDAGTWLFLGFILVPVYLFVREAKTNKNYVPGIVWCILFFVSLFI